MKNLLLIATVLMCTVECFANSCCNQLLNISFNRQTIEEMPSNDLLLTYNITYPQDSTINIDSIWYFIWYSFTNNEGLAVSENRLVFGELIEE
ncbi:MAG: hypothetical protein ACI9DK_000306 [Vicingaceae bacterium]|jgi:hypothetical protein